MVEKNLCDTCYHSKFQKGKTYCSYYDKYMHRLECSKFDHDVYKWFEGAMDKPKPVIQSVSKSKSSNRKKPKGLEIHDKKLQKKAKKRAEIKPSQLNICRFVTIRYEVIERVNGKYRRTGNQIVNGLQIKNKVYLNNGHYKLINSKSVKIMNTYTSIPEWANEHLLSLYDSHKKSLGGITYA